MRARKSVELPSYGIDAPAVIIGFLSVAIFGSTLLWAVNRWLTALGLIPMALGVSMLLYA